MLLRVSAENSCSLLVGVTSDEYVAKNKKHPVEPFDERVKTVLEYLRGVDKSLEVQVVRIGDAFGPSVEDAEADCIFVSEETLYGAYLVNLLRKIRGLRPLRVYCIETLTFHGVRLSSSLLWSMRKN